MKLRVSEELLKIFKKIVDRNLTIIEWREIESGDEFQSENFCGGFDSIEDEFCFSYYDANKTEYWFQKSLSEITEINKRTITEIEIRPVE